MTSSIPFRSFNEKYECNDDDNFTYSSTEQVCNPAM